jgi:flagellar protein FlaF
MSLAAHALNAYSDSRAPVRSERSLEYLAFARMTKQLQAIDIENPTHFAPLATALHDNLRLWNILAADVAQDGNPLPRNLRAKLFYLAEFTRTHTARVLTQEASHDVLIDINKMVMRGLRPGTDGME